MTIQNSTIDASPTKELFIDLVRDIPINRAIINLVDNAVNAINVGSGEKSSKTGKATIT